MPDATHCLCGETPRVGFSQRRVEARSAMAEQLKALDAQPHATGQAARDYERSKLALQVLAPDHVEVSCPACGRWVHDNSVTHAVILWNKAIAKLALLQPCCLASKDRRLDYDGMVLVVCDSPSHDETVAGRRYLPLDPDPSYSLKPSDAGVSR